MESGFRCEVEYDEERNIVVTRFIGELKSTEAVEYWMNEVLIPVWKGDGIHKNWRITDVTKVTKISSVAIMRYSELSKDVISRLSEEKVIIASTLLVRVGLRLFTRLSGHSFPIVKSAEKAEKIIEKWQKERGVFPSLQGE